MSKRKTALYLNEYMPKAEPFPFFDDLLKELSASGKRIAVIWELQIVSPAQAGLELQTRANLLGQDQLMDEERHDGDALA